MPPPWDLLMPQRCEAFSYRTAGGAEIDLVIDHPGGERWAIEVKRSLMPALSRGFPMAPGVAAVGLLELAAYLAG